MRRAIRSLLLGLAWASIWPAYLVLVAQAARLGPWPRNLGILASTALHGLALGAFIPGVLAWMTRRDGWTERFLGVPEAVGRQLCRTGRFLAAAAVIFLVPAYLLSSGEFAPGGRPIKAAAFCRFFILGFELTVWAALVPLVRRGSAILHWCDLATLPGPPRRTRDRIRTLPPSVVASMPDPAFIGRGTRGLRLAGLDQPAPAGGGLDRPGACRRHRGTRRAQDTVSQPGGWPSAEPRPWLFCLICWAFYRGVSRIIIQHAKRWVRPGRSWALVLTTAVTTRASSRTRDPEDGDHAVRGSVPAADPVQQEDLAGRLRQLVFYARGPARRIRVCLGLGA